MADNPFEEWQDRYGGSHDEEGPLKFVREQILRDDEVVDPPQEKILLALGRREREITVASCHGIGKTAVAAWGIIHHNVCRYPQLTAATAPSKAQLEDALLKEINIWFGRLPQAIRDLYDVTSRRIELAINDVTREQSFFTAATARAESPEALQGKHSANVLLVVDEASGVHENVYEAAIGSMSGENATTLMLSNPTRTSGTFFNSHQPGSDAFIVQVGHMDSPRVSDAYVEKVARKYGRNSNAFRVRALGLFPKSDDDTVVPHEYVASARERDIHSDDTRPQVWGLDVARFGDDNNCLIRRSDRELFDDVEVWGGLDLMRTTGKVKAKWDRTAEQRRPRFIYVDEIGLGSGVVDRLREMGLPVRGVNVAEAATVSEDYRNARAELWWKCREWLERKTCKLPPVNPDVDPREDPVERLCAELTMPKYKHTSSGKLEVEPKSDTKKRLKRSPDCADALVLTFSDDLHLLNYGRDRQWSRTQDLRRNLSLV